MPFVTQGVGNVLTAACPIHNIAMYQKRMPCADVAAVPVWVWTCPTCEALKASPAETKNASSPN